jgi:hypothetical protein
VTSSILEVWENDFVFGGSPVDTESKIVPTELKRCHSDSLNIPRCDEAVKHLKSKLEA